MTDKGRDYLVVVIFLFFVYGFALLCVFKPVDKISESERRLLAQKPQLSIESILDSRFMEDFESYSMDQFPLRDSFRKIKAFTAFYVLQQKDVNGIYVADGYASKLEYPLNQDSLDYAVKKLNQIYEKYLNKNQTKVYLSIIPDKNYFLAKENGYPELDYSKLTGYLTEKLPEFQYIDIFDSLEIQDYYRSDTHWKQEKIKDVAEKISTAMGTPFLGMYEEKQVEKPFYGVYYGQSALPLPSEKITYLDNDILASCEVYDYETEEYLTVYDMEKAAGKDPYEVFLSGPKSLLRIYNEEALTEKKLIVFRDSFGSSIAPLWIEGYREIILIDIRYLSSEFLGRMIDFKESDVLFLYSTLVLNNSITLK